MGIGAEEYGRQEAAAYIENMLVELRTLSQEAKVPMLTYLIEMALIEASDVAAGRDTATGSFTESMPDQLARLYMDGTLK